jgi:hypothetical protein
MKPAFKQNLFALAAGSLSLLVMSVYGENVKITRVIDSNLFELNDGRRIRLSHVESPSISDPDPAIAYLAGRIKRFGEEKLPGENLTFEYAGPLDETCSCQPVHLFTIGFFYPFRVISRDDEAFIPPLPSLGLRIGRLSKGYLSIDLLNDFLISPLAIGFNYRVVKPRIYFYFGAADNGAGFKTDVGLSTRYILKMQGFVQEFENETRYGVRLGLGYVLQ